MACVFTRRTIAPDLSAPGYFFQATDMPGLMRWMAAEAERAGARLMYRPQIRGRAGI